MRKILSIVYCTICDQKIQLWGQFINLSGLPVEAIDFTYASVVSISEIKQGLGHCCNSSAGVREASVFGIPSINIGTRQNNRGQHSSIINVDENEKEILKAITEIPKRFKPSLNFGRGDSAKSFIKTISEKSFWKIPNQKQFNDILKDWKLNG